MQGLEAYRRKTKEAASLDASLHFHLLETLKAKGEFNELSLVIQLSLTMRSVYRPEEVC